MISGGRFHFFVARPLPGSQGRCYGLAGVWRGFPLFRRSSSDNKPDRWTCEELVRKPTTCAGPRAERRLFVGRSGVVHNLRLSRRVQKRDRIIPIDVATGRSVFGTATFVFLRSGAAAHREVLPSVTHRSGQYENNRAEVSHQHTREQERQMRRFKSAAQLQCFLCVHGPIHNLFRVGRHRLKAVHHRLLRERAFTDWKKVTCVC